MIVPDEKGSNVDSGWEWFLSQLLFWGGCGEGGREEGRGVVVCIPRSASM